MISDTPLRRARKARNKSIPDVAAETGIDPGNLSRIERGVQFATKDTVEKLVRYYGEAVSEMEILYPERFPPPDSNAA